MCKKFFNVKMSRDLGTLSNLKVLISRTNVNGNVKSRYKAHEDFLTTCGTRYFLLYIMNKFKMTAFTDEPKHPAIKQSIKTWTNEPKKKIFQQIMDEIIKDLFIPFEMTDPSFRIQATIGTQKIGFFFGFCWV
ncbi:hypothetical protein ACF0H5_020729 [Mactra antiquata]